MALHKDFPKDKFQILDPAIRWFPAGDAWMQQQADIEKGGII